MPLEKMICGENYTTELIKYNINGLIEAGIRYESAPAGFNWPETLPAVLAAKVGGTYACNLRPEDLIDFSVFANYQYVDINMPNDNGDGLSWATAERGIGNAVDNAIASGVPTRILVKGGIYPRFRSIGGSNTSKVLTAPITIESVYGDVTTGTFDELAYTKTTGQDYVYQANRSSVLAAYNPSTDSKRAGESLFSQVDSISECNSKQGTWYTDGAIFYVHTFNSAPASNGNVIAVLSAKGAEFAGNQNIYMSGINLIGGNTGSINISGGSTNSVVVNRCSFKLAVGGGGGGTPKDGCEILGCKIFAAFNSDASLNSKDGFNIHIEGGVEPSLLTVNCAGYDNGMIFNDSLSNNGITVHDGLKAIDIGGEWLGSVGTNAGHVGGDTQVWHFGSTTGQSEGDIINGGPINYGGFGVWSGAAEMWLDSCVDFSTSKGITASGTAQAYVRNHSGTGARNGNISEY